MSFDRRRWMHLFPLRTDGTPIFQHWINVKRTSATQNEICAKGEYKSQQVKATTSSEQVNKHIFNVTKTLSDIPSETNTKSSQNPIVTEDNISEDSCESNDSIATMIAGVAWKSLTIPACLPITTDYKPNDENQQTNFTLVKDYSLTLEDIRLSHDWVTRNIKAIKMKDILPELVGHRIGLIFKKLLL